MKWTSFVKKVQQEQGISYKDALTVASKKWKKGGNKSGSSSVSSSIPPPPPPPKSSFSGSLKSVSRSSKTPSAPSFISPKKTTKKISGPFSPRVKKSSPYGPPPPPPRRRRKKKIVPDLWDPNPELWEPKILRKPQKIYENVETRNEICDSEYKTNKDKKIACRLLASKINNNKNVTRVQDYTQATLKAIDIINNTDNKLINVYKRCKESQLAGKQLASCLYRRSYYGNRMPLKPRRKRRSK